ncbi:MAG: hypothetical protein ACRD8O_14660 [Bryobacteraceae bacterium]
MRIVFAVAVTLMLAVSGFAADFEGFLVDKACSDKAVKDGYKVAGAHSKDCALMDGCADSGFGILTADNRYLLFDTAGSKKAVAAIKASSKKDNFKVKVSGKVDGSTIKVSKIKIV